MTAHDEPAAGGTPLEQLIEASMSLIGDVRAAIAARPATVDADAHGPAYITGANWEAVISAAASHMVSVEPFWGASAAVCRTCGVLLAEALPQEDTRYIAAEHAAAEVLKAARVEVQRG